MPEFCGPPQAPQAQAKKKSKDSAAAKELKERFSLAPIISRNFLPQGDSD